MHVGSTVEYLLSTLIHVTSQSTNCICFSHIMSKYNSSFKLQTGTLPRKLQEQDILNNPWNNFLVPLSSISSLCLDRKKGKQFRCHLQPYAGFNSHRSVSVGASDWPKLSVPLFAYLDYLHRSYFQIMFIEAIFKSCSLTKQVSL